MAGDAFGLTEYFKDLTQTANDVSAGTVALAASVQSVRDVFNPAQAKASAEQAKIAANQSQTAANANTTGQNPIAVYLTRSGPGNVPVWIYAVAGLGLLFVLVRK